MIMELVAVRERDAERIRRDEARIDALLSKVDELLSKVDELSSLQKATMATEKELDDYKAMVSNLLSKITALEERLKVRTRTFMNARARRESVKSV